jgi:hypothetical protein
LTKHNQGATHSISIRFLKKDFRRLRQVCLASGIPVATAVRLLSIWFTGQAEKEALEIDRGGVYGFRP